MAQGEAIPLAFRIAPGLKLFSAYRHEWRNTSRLSTPRANDALRTTPPVDLRILNHERVAAMGVDPSVIELFMVNGAFSPTHQTLFVAALDEMKGVADRDQFVRFAVLSDEEDVAFFRQRQAQLLHNRSRSSAPAMPG